MFSLSLIIRHCSLSQPNLFKLVKNGKWRTAAVARLALQKGLLLRCSSPIHSPWSQAQWAHGMPRRGASHSIKLEHGNSITAPVPFVRSTRTTHWLTTLNSSTGWVDLTRDSNLRQPRRKSSAKPLDYRVLIWMESKVNYKIMHLMLYFLFNI